MKFEIIEKKCFFYPGTHDLVFGEENFNEIEWFQKKYLFKKMDSHVNIDIRKKTMVSLKGIQWLQRIIFEIRKLNLEPLLIVHPNHFLIFQKLFFHKFVEMRCSPFLNQSSLNTILNCEKDLLWESFR